MQLSLSMLILRFLWILDLVAITEPTKAQEPNNIYNKLSCNPCEFQNNYASSLVNKMLSFGVKFLALLALVFSTAGAIASAAPAPRRSVFVFRHCLRSTPFTVSGAKGFDSFDNYSAQAWPEWGVPVFQCLPQGLKVVEHVGSQLKGSFAQPLHGPLVDSSAKRDNDTALALLRGLGLPPSIVPKAELFNTIPSLCPGISPADRYNATLRRFREYPPAADHEIKLAWIQQLLGKGVAPAIEDIKDTICKEGGQWPSDLVGGSAVASSVTEAFLMQLGGGMEVAWNKLGDDRAAVAELVYDLLSTHVYQRGVESRFLDVVRDQWSWMSTLISDFLAGKGISSESTNDGTLVLVGHDSDLDALGVMFGLEWNPAPFPVNATVPNSALRFDFDDDSGSVSVSYLYTTFESATPSLRTAPATFTWSAKKDGGVDGGADAGAGAGAVSIDALQERIASLRNTECLPSSAGEMVAAVE